MATLLSEKNLQLLFKASVLVKGVHAVLELVSGAAILLISPTFVLWLAQGLTANELSEDPKDFFANYLMHSAGQFSVSFQHLAALYLISHGIVVGFLVAGLLARKLWSYPVSVAVLGIFILYQSYQFFLSYSWWIFGVTILDIVVILLTLHEYRYLKKI
jgi:uncharacterized membrane protein